MTDTRLRFAFLVALPTAAAAVVTGFLAAGAVRDARVTEDLRMARAALTLLQWDLGRATDDLVPRASPLPDPDPELPAVRRATAGDTVAALDASRGRLEVTVHVGAMGPDGDVELRYAAAPFDPSFMRALEGIAGYEAALYLNGVRRTGTDPGFGPESLETSLLRRLSRERAGVSADLVEGSVAAAALEGPRTTLASVVVLAAPSAAWGPAVPFRLWLWGVALAAVLVAVGWGGLGRNDLTRGRVALLTLLPAAVAAATLLSTLAAVRSGRDRIVEDGLARTLALVRAEAEGRSADELTDLTGLAALRLLPDGTEESSVSPAPARQRAVEIARAYRDRPTDSPSAGITPAPPHAATVFGDGTVAVLTPTSAEDPLGLVRRWLMVVGGGMLALACWFAVTSAPRRPDVRAG